MKYHLTYGAELEFGDIDKRKGLPEGCGWDTSDPSIMNSNGIAADPKNAAYHFGGEVQTKPTTTIREQVDVFEDVLNWFEHKASVNHRTNLHIHIRIPGLRDNLSLLKYFQTVIHQQFAQIIEELEPIPKPTKEECVYDKTFVGAMRRFKRRKRSHHMFLPEYRWKNQIETNTLSDFFAKEAPFNKNGKPMWHAQARVCINLRQLLQTDTIEFRHFPATINSKEFEDSLIWCDNFVRAVLEHKSIIETWAKIKNQLIFPKFAPYRHDLDVIYRRTCWDGTVDKSTIAENIESILRGKPKILVVCLGNINRSPAIESILKKRQYPTKSAGFLSKHSSASHKTVEFMMSLGYDISQHKSRQVTETMCEWADIILVTTSKHQERMRTLFPKYKTKVKCFYNDLLDPGPLEGDSFCNVMNNLVKQTQLFLDVLVDPGGKFFDDAIKHGLFS